VDLGDHGGPFADRRGDAPGRPRAHVGGREHAGKAGLERQGGAVAGSLAWRLTTSIVPSSTSHRVESLSIRVSTSASRAWRSAHPGAADLRWSAHWHGPARRRLEVGWQEM
jgi:hypothetical protein